MGGNCSYRESYNDNNNNDLFNDFNLQDKIIFIMTVCFKSVKYKLKHAIGFFDLLGFDFMLDTDMNVSIIFDVKEALKIFSLLSRYG